MASAFYAHSPADKSKFEPPDGWQPLAQHLLAVARLAQRFASEARPVLVNDGVELRRENEALSRAAYCAGLLHDLGKYRREFQLKLLFESKGQRAPVPRESTYHKQAGAAKAFDAGNGPVAFAIAGHHGGLPDRIGSNGLDGLVAGPCGRTVASSIWPTAVQDCPDLVSASLQALSLRDRLQADLLTRLLFSCLVDADWSDTANHQRSSEGLPPDPIPAPLEAEKYLGRILKFIAKRAQTCPANIAGLRDEVLQSCLKAANQAPGLFSLTVPTGGGKTLSSLAFALKHAAEHKLANGLSHFRRIIYVAPYLSIIDQNARVIRQALGIEKDDWTVFEHHSLAELPGDDDQNDTDREAQARRSENWDSPIIITTSVQFFESLFANKPGRCRKLHNIARSIVLLDECQTLPPGLVAPSCSMLKQLGAELSSSIVLCTATQPAFNHPEIPERLESLREIIPEELRRQDDRDLFVRLRRVRVAWPKKTEAPRNWPGVASTMREHTAALCIVNTRRAARELFAQLKQSGGAVFHLSTSMCPVHRLAVLDEVRRRLENNQNCYLASTQLIEAGVDVDFPFVMRELAPLEAVVQAAGRCNREGKLNGPDGSAGGRVIVFRSAAAQSDPKKYYPPDRWYKAGRSVLEASFLNNDREPQINNPADINEYFERLYHTGNLDTEGIQAARRGFEFAAVAERYRLIDDDGIPVVVATWEERREEVENLLAGARHRRSRANFRKLAPFQVNLRRYELQKDQGSWSEEIPGVYVWRGGYDPDLGLTSDNADVLLLV
jgi:CRISPR-associated endonuclease/helicase Cas3